jgi:hypothetical protein
MTYCDAIVARAVFLWMYKSHSVRCVLASVSPSNFTSFTLHFNKPNPTSNFQLPTTNMQNEHGQGASHATGDSKVPDAIQQKAPQGLEESLPNKVSITHRP